MRLLLLAFSCVFIAFSPSWRRTNHCLACASYTYSAVNRTSYFVHSFCSQMFLTSQSEIFTSHNTTLSLLLPPTFHSFPTSLSGFDVLSFTSINLSSLIPHHLNVFLPSPAQSQHSYHLPVLVSSSPEHSQSSVSQRGRWFPVVCEGQKYLLRMKFVE